MNPDLVKGPWTKEEDQKASAGRGAAHTGLGSESEHPCTTQRLQGLQCAYVSVREASFVAWLVSYHGLA